MEQKLVRVPFEVDLAKRIQNGEVDGKIVTRDGRNARVVCWDRQYKKPLISLIVWDDIEEIRSVFINGKMDENREDFYDLMLEIPEYMTFKDGDIIAFGNTKGNLSIGIFKKQVGAASHECYAMLSKYGILTFDVKPLTYNNARFATEEEKQKLIDALKTSNESKAKEYLKRFFGIEQKQECEFKPKDWVLIRNNSEDEWCLDIYSHKVWDKDEECYHYYCVGGWGYQCIPYNDQTAHLLGTTDDWEE